MFRNRTVLVVSFFCVIHLALHLIADFNSGFQGDELLHIETGNHPAFGYMEFPPVIGWLAYVQNLFHSDAVFVHHIFCHIASLLILVLMALVTIELGGKTEAVFMVLLCVSIMPARAHQLFQPVVFSHFFWILSFYQLVRFVKALDKKYLIYLSVSLAFGFLTKFDILFFIAGLSGVLLFKRIRTAILTKFVWIPVLLFLVLISPNIWWQYQHQFPVLDMFSRLYETQLNKLTIGGVIKDLIIMLNPFTLFIWLGGFFFMYRNKSESDWYRPLAVSILISILLLALNKSKAYYFVAPMLTLMIFGGIWFQQNILSKRKWIIYPVSIIMLASGILIAPFGLALLPIETFTKFAGLEMKNGRFQNKDVKADCQEYYSLIKWRNTLTALKEVYDSLPPIEKQGCLIWGKHYSQAGGVNLYGAAYGLPKAFCYHGSFYLWSPEKGVVPETVIAFTNGEAEIDFFQDFFSSVVAVKQVYNPYASFDKDIWQTIFICKKPKQDFAGLRQEFKTRIFE